MAQFNGNENVNFLVRNRFNVTPLKNDSHGANVFVEWDNLNRVRLLNRSAVETEVFVQVHDDVISAIPASSTFITKIFNSTKIEPEPTQQIVIRTEEVCIVLSILVLWVVSIALFFNRWGKIRMLEPYQPKFEQPHRPSCPLVVDTAVNTGCSISDLRKQRMSFSKFNIIDPPQCPTITSPARPFHARPRQNSVFTPSSPTVPQAYSPRRSQSVMDITYLLQQDTPLGKRPSSFSSTLHMRSTSKEYMSPVTSPNRASDRRPSITFDPVAQRQLSEQSDCEPSVASPPNVHTKLLQQHVIKSHRRPSSYDITRYISSYKRRPSCLPTNIERHLLYNRRKFISFDQGGNRDEARRLSHVVDAAKMSPVLLRSHRPVTIAGCFDRSRRPSVTVDPPPIDHLAKKPSPNSNPDEHLRTTSPTQKSRAPPLRKQTTMHPETSSYSFATKSLDRSTGSGLSMELCGTKKPLTLEDVRSGKSERVSALGEEYPWTLPMFVIGQPTPSPMNPSVSIAMELEMEREKDDPKVTNV